MQGEALQVQTVKRKPMKFAYGRYLLCALLLSPFSSLLAQEPSRNVLVIYVDDLGYGDTGVCGHSIVKTPHIDRLASEGLRFTQFYAPSALCSPPRCNVSR